MQPYLKFQLNELQTLEDAIARDSTELARRIFSEHLDYERIAEHRDSLTLIIDKVIQCYEHLFSFDIHYNEERRLQNILSDINSWIHDEYGQDGD